MTQKTTCLNWTLGKPETFLNWPHISDQDFKKLCKFNLCKSNICLNQTKFSVVLCFTVYCDRWTRCFLCLFRRGIVLRKQKAQLSDSGTYVCEARNVVGTTRQEVVIKGTSFYMYIVICPYRFLKPLTVLETKVENSRTKTHLNS